MKIPDEIHNAAINAWYQDVAIPGAHWFPAVAGPIYDAWFAKVLADAVLAEREAIKTTIKAEILSTTTNIPRTDLDRAFNLAIKLCCAIIDVRSRTTNPEIAGGLHPPQSSLPSTEGDADRAPGFAQPDPGYHERDEPMIATASPTPAKATCGNCKFWDGDGNCLRYPPIMSLHIIDNQKPTYDIAPFFPWTNADHWCGEYARKDGGV